MATFVPLRKLMSREDKRVFMMVIGALTAAVVVFTQLFLYEGPSSVGEEVKTEKTTEKSSGDQIFLSGPSDTVLSSFHAGVHHEPVFLFEILFDRQDNSNWTPEIPVSLGKYFLTLFHIIISPNAP